MATKLKPGKRYIVMNGIPIPVEKFSEEERKKIFAELNDRALRTIGMQPVED